MNSLKTKRQWNSRAGSLKNTTVNKTSTKRQTAIWSN